MPYILCLETSTTNCSVALSKDGKVIAFKEDYDIKYSHAERLHQFITIVMKEAGIALDKLDAIAVSKGPGSYTGLRIGVSAAKGLCFGLNIPLISVSTLKGLALQVKSMEGFVVPMLDARRMEVYSAVFSSDYKQVRTIEAEVLSEDSFSTYLENKQVFFIGNGVAKFEEICNHKNAKFITDKLPSAVEMGILGYTKFLEKDFEDVSYFEPYYLKDFVAG
ncbi:tRNA (adenosine(37)-N6)-threonylcarbamoyltransferase complex dimerization subunit type 1 TsaB [Aquimarina sp. MMG015]|uniref:tRNA (adenosine(37)-N6)-threonylcarbamoyltransferase complex dimerization subunit type 1 TsaB n=1 Tax=unclassified Aquimarina TaxID=2627091 RepID=UPI000E4C62DE|nr:MULTISPECIES: tRNA (adenosine(37)-N6)-threonylcarbamoyltransferase complex dimerization subunit type 1 TsaB [unclassified Aquimarina]AXT57843.1 tRNA (adenosine(37)-N6)-threonylcarbamoyltransferase complex dimerization subunit type 1 TsaB [Aquimarina sp. AD1]MBQ4803215.1 tRNA (adenosine(37)-N6)-threonylcarbamoyltransferase complex dimerization subunit type 1 TsaB [Aquimarina sp. MMG015]RKN34997.1 tRNA (adenosine(37)-N6)-threonylcarbamoyltransferase complex dimerization subunit type 1 TsaB [Aqu